MMYSVKIAPGADKVLAKWKNQILNYSKSFGRYTMNSWITQELAQDIRKP